MMNSIRNNSFMDTSIADDIRRKIEKMEEVDPSLVDVRVDNGNVTLSGMVPNRRTLHEVYNAALRTSGVTQVVNLLLVK
jgi:osmotically-inducible protein OsmY